MTDIYTEYTPVYRCAVGFRCIVEHGGYRFDVTGPDEAQLRAQAQSWAASVVDERDRRDDIDKLGAAVGIDTAGGRKADAVKALRETR